MLTEAPNISPSLFLVPAPLVIQDVTWTKPKMAMTSPRTHHLLFPMPVEFPHARDLERIKSTVHRLRASGFYYPGLSWHEANSLLEGREEGRFLVRDSADSNFLFSLSVRTRRGPTSIRIHYHHGEFRLDSEDRLAPFMPRFKCVLALVQNYALLSRTSKGTSCVWLDESGKRDQPILLGKPHLKQVSSLQHLCRLKINQHAGPSLLQNPNLPGPIRTYMKEYPYVI